MYDNPDITKIIPDTVVPVRVGLTWKFSVEETVLYNQYAFSNDCILIILDRKGNIIKWLG